MAKYQKYVLLLSCFSAMTMLGAGCDDGIGERCQVGTLRCNGDMMEACNGIRWETAQDCSKINVSCNQSTGKCDVSSLLPGGDEGDCVSGISESYCFDESTFVKCSDNHYISIPCGDDYRCQEGACVEKDPGVPGDVDPVECNDGESRCLNLNTVQICSKNVWVDALECEGHEKCEKGACVDDLACTDGDRRCYDQNTAQICTKGQWVESPCASNSMCEISSGICVENVCTNDEKRCSDNSVVVCKDNAWVVSQTCSDSAYCDKNSFECVENDCTNGEKRCSDNSVVVCNNNKWAVAQTCSKSETCEAGECVDIVCFEGAIQCHGTDVEVCKNNAWVVAQTCSKSEYCDAKEGACVKYDCYQGETRCADNNVEVCKNNKWSVSQKCLADEICNADTQKCDQKVCTEGSVRCEMNNLEKCDNNSWQLSQMCAKSQVCDDAAGKCISNTCTAGSKRCSNNILYTCSKDTWVESKTCSDGMTCSSEVGDCVCYEGDVACNPDDTNNTSMLYCDIKSGASYGTSMKKLLCNENEYYNEVANYCLADYGSVCQTNQVCNSRNGRNDSFCGEDGSTIYSCSGGILVEKESCSGKTPYCYESTSISYGSTNYTGTTAACRAEKYGSNCRNGSTTCSGNILLTCNNGKYTETVCDKYCVKTVSGQSWNQTTSGSCSDHLATSCSNEEFMNKVMRCSEDGSQVETCRRNNNSMSWSASQKCGADSVCVKTSENEASCVAKDSDTALQCDQLAKITCSDDKLVQCTKYGWQEITNCANFGLTCSGGRCINTNNIILD